MYFGKGIYISKFHKEYALKISVHRHPLSMWENVGVALLTCLLYRRLQGIVVISNPLKCCCRPIHNISAILVLHCLPTIFVFVLPRRHTEGYRRCFESHLPFKVYYTKAPSFHSLPLPSTMDFLLIVRENWITNRYQLCDINSGKIYY